MNNKTIKNNIWNILENIDTNIHDMPYYVDRIHEIYLKSQIRILKSCVEHPTKPGYQRHDILKKINELEKELNEIK